MSVLAPIIILNKYELIVLHTIVTISQFSIFQSDISCIIVNKKSIYI